MPMRSVFSSKSRLGEVQATPTSYTLLRRLKDLLTGIVLAAGTAIIGKVRLVDSGGTEITEATGHSVQVKLISGTAVAGKVGHDKTGVGHGVTVSTSVGTAVVLAASTPAKIVIIQAQTDNTGAVAVGGSGVLATVATGTGVLLYAGDSITLEVDNLNDVYFDVTVSGDGVRYTYLT